MASEKPQKTLVIGAGPVGALAALYAANRGDEVEIYELRGGKSQGAHISFLFWNELPPLVLHAPMTCL